MLQKLENICKKILKWSFFSVVSIFLTLPNQTVLTPSRSLRRDKGQLVLPCIKPAPSSSRSSSRQPRAPHWHPGPCLHDVSRPRRQRRNVVANAHMSASISTSACPSFEGGPCPCCSSCHGPRYRHALSPPSLLVI